MACTHLRGGLQVLICKPEGWFHLCLRCGAKTPVADAALEPSAGRAAAQAAEAFFDRRFDDAQRGFALALQVAPEGDPRWHFALLLCQLGVQFCGDEYQPTFFTASPPALALAESDPWQRLRTEASRLPEGCWEEMQQLLRQLEEIRSRILRREGLAACDAFLCYRRDPVNVQSALALYSDLTRQGLRVFCADVSTRGKTQEEFEAEVFHALRTAEHLILFPGEGENALTPWLQNELDRAVCPMENRFIASDGHDSLPAGLGQALSLNEIRMRLSAAAALNTPDSLWTRAVCALKEESGLSAALPLLLRLSAAEYRPARLLLALLYEEGLLCPRNAARAQHFHLLAKSVREEERRLVYAALEEIEAARHLTARRPLIYVAADVSDAGVTASQQQLKLLLSRLLENRRLAQSDLCLIGYDRHARIIEPPKPLDRYGLPEYAARLLHTSREDGRDQCAYAAKGLRCAAAHLMETGCGEGRLPLAALLSPGTGSDASMAVEAAVEAVRGLFANAEASQITAAAQIPGCIDGMLRALRP